jgi:hypothetical protein
MNIKGELDKMLHTMKTYGEMYVTQENVGETGCKSTCHEDVRGTGSRLHVMKTYGELDVKFHGMKIYEEQDIKHFATKI